MDSKILLPIGGIPEGVIGLREDYERTVKITVVKEASASLSFAVGFFDFFPR